MAEPQIISTFDNTLYTLHIDIYQFRITDLVVFVN